MKKPKLMRGHTQDVRVNEHTKEVCPYCGRCQKVYDHIDGSYINWDCQTSY